MFLGRALTHPPICPASRNRSAELRGVLGNSMKADVYWPILAGSKPLDTVVFIDRVIIYANFNWFRRMRIRATLFDTRDPIFFAGIDIKVIAPNNVASL